MKNPVASISSPGQLTVLAALLAGLCAPALAASDIVISQLYGAGGNNGALFNRDYIELFNRGTTPIDITNWSVQYASTTGTSWTNKTNITTTPAGGAVVLQPGQYYLVAQASGATGAALPTPDLSGSIGMAAAAGKVALVNNTTALGAIANPAGTAGVIDVVSFGLGSTPTEGTPTAGLSTTLAALRNSGGCTDLDNNNADFSVTAPAPRNSATTKAACGVTTIPAIVIKTACPATLSLAAGAAGTFNLVASDADSAITGASITAGARAGISLSGFVGSVAGADASATLNADASLPGGSFPVNVTFTNGAASESATCTVTVKVSGNSTISQIQGAGAKSPVAETVQTTEGVITFKMSNGFYIQDINGDGDPTTSDGIFVFGGSTTAVVGDLVRVTGTVTEFTPGSALASITEFKDTTSIVKLGGGYTITPTNVTMPMDLERVEGMLVRFTAPLIVNANDSLGDRGELTLASVRRETPTNRYRPGTPEALALAAQNTADQIVLDDLIFVQSATIPYVAADKTVRAGDKVNDLTGMVDYGSIGNSKYGYKLQPLSPASVEIERFNARTAAPTIAAGNVKVASANVLNFFTSFTNGGAVAGTTPGCTISGNAPVASVCRGADSLAEFERQRAKIVNELSAINADVVGLMEIQNNGNVAVNNLVGALNAAMGPNTYASVAVPSFSGTDAIRVAMIYKPGVVIAVGAPVSDPDTVINNRAPLAQTFKAANGGKFSVIVNHLKSKSCGSASGANTDKGDGQSCYNADRIEQAVRLRDYFIPRVISESGDPDVLVIGDMNAHGFEDPIFALTSGANGMVNELERFVRPDGIVYSYSFDGLAAYLDHALATQSLDAQVAGATEWHNNADEPEVIDYNFNLGTSSTAKPQDLYENNAYRASDHDPVVVSLNLAPSFVDATASFSIMRSGLAINRITGKYTGTLSFTNNTAAPVSGPFQVVFNGLTAGVTLDNKSGLQGGYPYITVSNATVAPGATVTLPLTFSNPSRAAVGYTPQIISGSF